MPDFRYAQFCPLARAAELLGERWTLLVVRELLFGPQRFSDLRKGLAGVSPSVLSERLTRLEERGLVRRQTLPPPSGASVYELTEVGGELRPVIVELARWGARFLGPPEPGEQLTPRALRLGLHFLSKRGAAPELRFGVHARDEEGEERFQVRGGADGAQVTADEGPVDARVSGHPFVLAALAAGVLDPAQALRAGQIRTEGDSALLADLPLLFDLQPPTQEEGSQECPS